MKSNPSLTGQSIIQSTLLAYPRGRVLGQYITHPEGNEIVLEYIHGVLYSFLAQRADGKTAPWASSFAAGAEKDSVFIGVRFHN